MKNEPKAVATEKVLAHVEAQRNAAMTQLALANAHIEALGAALDEANRLAGQLTEGD